jgi:hypothetical protein
MLLVGIDPVTQAFQQTRTVHAAGRTSTLIGERLYKYIFFFVIPFHLQTVLVHSANYVNNVYNGITPL